MGEMGAKLCSLTNKAIFQRKFHKGRGKQKNYWKYSNLSLDAIVAVAAYSPLL